MLLYMLQILYLVILKIRIYPDLRLYMYLLLTDKYLIFLSNQ